MKTKRAEHSRSRREAVADVAEPEPRDRPVAVDGVHLDVVDDLDLGVALDPAGEIVGHALADVAAAEQERGAGGVIGEEHRPPGRPSCRRPPRRPGRRGTSGRGPRCRNRRPRAVPPLGSRRPGAADRRPRSRSGPSGRSRPARRRGRADASSPRIGHRSDLDRGDELGPELQGLESSRDWRGPRRSGRRGIPCNSRSASSSPPGRPGRSGRGRSSTGPPRRRRRPPPGRPARRRRSRGRTARRGSAASGRGTRPASSPSGRGRPSAPVARDERQLIRRALRATSIAARPAGSSTSTQVWGTLFLSKNSRISVRSGSPSCPKTRTPTNPDRSSMTPPGLEGFEKLVAEVGDLLDDPPQFLLATQYGRTFPRREGRERWRGGRSGARRRP